MNDKSMTAFFRNQYYAISDLRTKYIVYELGIIIKLELHFIVYLCVHVSRKNVFKLYSITYIMIIILYNSTTLKKKNLSNKFNINYCFIKFLKSM